MLNSNEVLDDLNLDGLKIIQDRNGYCFTSDSVVLANFVDAKTSDTCLEIGTGSGVISILVEHKNKPKKIVCFEIQKRLADMAKRSIELNNKQNQIEVINDKIQNYDKYIEKSSIDVIFTNPPYRKLNSSLKSDSKEKTICRYEEELTLDEICSISSKLLKDKGKFYIIYEAGRTCELVYKLKQNKLEPKKMFFTSPSIEKNPILVVIMGVKNGKEGVKVLPELITNDNDGNYILTLKNLYKKG